MTSIKEDERIIKRAEARSLGLKEYFTGRECKHGHISSRYTSSGVCKDCFKLKRRSAQATPTNIIDSGAEPAPVGMSRDDAIENGYLLYQPMKECVRSHVAPRTSRSMLCIECQKIFKNKRELETKHWNDLYKSAYRRSLSSLKHALIKQLTPSDEKTMNEFKSRIESLFTEGMTWDNYGDWHIDHIIPLSQIDLTTNEGIKMASDLKNLQPLWASDNMSKGGKFILHPDL